MKISEKARIVPIERSGDGDDRRKAGKPEKGSDRPRRPGAGTEGPGEESPKEGRSFRILSIIFMALLAAVMIWLPLSRSIIVRGIVPGDFFQIRLSEPNWNANRYIKKGISMDEGAFTWTDGNKVSFYPFNVSEDGDYMLTLSVDGIFTDSQRAVFVLNDQAVDERRLEGAEEISLVLQMKKGKNELGILLEDAASPAEFMVGHDSRKLALRLTMLTLEKKA